MTLRRPLHLLLLVALSVPTVAHAQAEVDKATARALGQQGEKALQAKDWARAEDFFHRAETLFHAPTLCLGLARAQVQEGKFVEAWENYHRIVLDNVTSPAVFAKALEDAKAEISPVEGKRARLTITVTGAEAPRVNVNDVAINGAALGVERFVDPGHLVVTAAADGFKTETRTLDLAPGKADAVVIALTQDAVVPVAATVGQVAPAPVAPSHTSLLRSAGYGALAVGGAGLVVGAITGGLALAKHGDLTSECPKGACTTTASQSALSTYQTMGAVSTAAFVVGIAGVGAGVTLLLVAPKSDSRSPSPSAVAVHPYFGLGAVGATGTF